MPTRNREKKESSFEEDLEALETTVAELEAGRLGLEEAMQRFESGVSLAARLRKRLDAAEGRIEQLLADGTTSPLDVD